MQLIEITLSGFARRCRSLSVRHSDLELARGLEYGERVLVLSDGEYRTAVVNHIDFDLDDTHYQLVLGGLVPPELARERLAGTVPATPTHRVSVHDVADLLARSGAAHRIPMQRRAASRLLSDS